MIINHIICYIELIIGNLINYKLYIGTHVKKCLYTVNIIIQYSLIYLYVWDKQFYIGFIVLL